MTSVTLLGHKNPDHDCLFGLYLLWAVEFDRQAEVIFAPIGPLNSYLEEVATACVDTGSEYDPTRLRFDHHGQIDNIPPSSSASSLVWNYLMDKGDDVGHFAPLVNLITGADLGYTHYMGMDITTSILCGIHAELAEHKKREGITDRQLWDWARGKFEVLGAHLWRRAQDVKRAEQCVVWRSGDGRVVCTVNGNRQTTQTLHENGAQLVVYHNPITHSRGVMRAATQSAWSVGLLVEIALNQDDTDPAIADELAEWYRDDRGFFAGRGSSKGPEAPPMTVSIVDIAALLSEMLPF